MFQNKEHSLEGRRYWCNKETSVTKQTLIKQKVTIVINSLPMINKITFSPDLCS